MTVASGSGGVVRSADAASEITGIVYNDANRNGVRDAGEAALTGRSVTAVPASGTGTSFTATSNSNGAYRLFGLPPGTYALQLTSQATAWVQVTPDGGRSRVVTVGAVETVAGVDFGQAQLASAKITGTAFADFDGNGVKGTGEPNLSRLIFLDANGNGPATWTRPRLRRRRGFTRSASCRRELTWFAWRAAAGGYGRRRRPTTPSRSPRARRSR